MRLTVPGQPASALRGYGAAAFAWLAEPKLTYRRHARVREVWSFDSLRSLRTLDLKVVNLTFASWKHLSCWLRRIERLRGAA